MNSKIRFLLLLALATGAIVSCKKTNYISRVNTPPIDSTTKDSSYIDSALYTISGSGGVDTGAILLSFNADSSGVLAILNQKGYVLKEKKVPLRIENFQKWNINGIIRYTYLQTSGSYMLNGVASTEEGYDVVLDSNLNEINRFSLLPYETVDTAGDNKLDMHDFILLGDNHYMAISYRVENPTNIPDSLHPASNVSVIACLIQEVNNGQVVFQWDGTDYPELFSSSVENNNFSDSVNTLDYMHMNSICIDPRDNNIICSFRNLNEIIKINRTTGAIMWRLGGDRSDFALTSDEVFLRQHYARLTDNNQTLIFVDNGQQQERAYSRIVQFQLDENSKTVTGFTAYKIPDKFIQYAGSVLKQNGNFFIGGGSASYALQINYTTNDVLLRINQNYSSYRAVKY